MLHFSFCIPGESRKEGLLYLYCDHFNSQGGEIIYNPDFPFISVILVQVCPCIIILISPLFQSFWCKFVHVLFFYFLVASYMWIFVEGIYLHTLIIITTFHNLSRRLFRSLIVFGWGKFKR